MGDFQNLMVGFSIALSLQNLLYAFIGCMMGTLIGVLPGIGPIAGIAILLPLTFQLPADGRHHHAVGDLLRRDVRRHDHHRPDERAGRGVVGRHLPRRLSDGAEGPCRARRSALPPSAPSSAARSRRSGSVVAAPPLARLA